MFAIVTTIMMLSSASGNLTIGPLPNVNSGSFIRFIPGDGRPCILDKWNHRWFGVWREYGPAYEYCPSVRDFVFPTVVRCYDKARLRQYLTKAQIVASTSRHSFPCPFTGKLTGGSISFRTDGRWVWLDDLADYIDQYDVAIPTDWLREIEKNEYVPPFVEEAVVQKLEWPPVKGQGTGQVKT